MTPERAEQIRRNLSRKYNERDTSGTYLYPKRKRGNPPEFLEAMAILLGFPSRKAVQCQVQGRHSGKIMLHHKNGWRDCETQSVMWACHEHHRQLDNEREGHMSMPQMTDGQLKELVGLRRKTVGQNRYNWMKSLDRLVEMYPELQGRNRNQLQHWLYEKAVSKKLISQKPSLRPRKIAADRLTLPLNVGIALVQLAEQFHITWSE
jgi:hypothetical protein